MKKNFTIDPIPYLKETRRKNKKKYTTFLKGLIRRKVRGLDNFAIALHKDAFKKIDCLECANCCKTMSPTYTKTDVKRISAHIGMGYKEYFDKYLYTDDTGDILNKKTPCHFLKADNKCSIYPVRPKDCSGFPHTNLRDFKLFISGTHIQNISYCPATMHIVDKMYKVIIEKGKRNLSAEDVKLKV